ncbi:MAG: hypothetical protein E6868_22415 [Pantoea sp.]|uniref:hypothetical protein n=1 Tax=Pantoea sp. TaxID=69393 RepID=UPI002900D46A|nr:hypothetical protein [Pantoea sp.]MDU1575977.1 hypothetical protein [Pantoea sp.]
MQNRKTVEQDPFCRFFNQFTQKPEKFRFEKWQTGLRFLACFEQLLTGLGRFGEFWGWVPPQTILLIFIVKALKATIGDSAKIFGFIKRGDRFYVGGDDNHFSCGVFLSIYYPHYPQNK